MSELQGRQFTGTMTGGSEADSARRSNAISFFQKGVKYLIPSEKKRISGRILPARDPNLSANDASWLTSVIPYRDVLSGYMDSDTKTPKFNAFWGNIKCYSFWGRLQACITSPQTLKYVHGASVSDQADPIEDCRIYCKKHGDEMFGLVKASTLIDKIPNSREKPPIPHAQDKSVFNMYCAEERGQWDTQLVVVAGQAVEDLKKKLSWYTTTMQVGPHDPNFPSFLFGDVTNPATGLLATISPFTVGTMTVNGFNFSIQDQTLEGYKVFPVGENELKKRYNFLTPEVLRIETYQDLVNFIVDDGTIPYELIQLACGRMANIPKAPKQNTTVSSPMMPAHHQVGGIMGMPVGGSAPAAVQIESIAPGAPSDKYWINGPTGVVETTAANIMSAVKLGGDPMVMAFDYSGGWKTASLLGFKLVVPTPPAAPTPPPPPAAPTPPPAPTPEPPAAPQPIVQVPARDMTPWWVAHKGVTSDKPACEVQDLFDAGEKLLVMKYDKSTGWLAPEAAGFVKDNIPMGAPAAPAAPAAPMMGPAPIAADSSRLTAEEAAQFASMQARAESADAPGGALSPDEMSVLVRLTMKNAGMTPP